MTDAPRAGGGRRQPGEEEGRRGREEGEAAVLPASSPPRLVSSSPSLRPAVFLDRDGTLNEDAGYVHRAESVVWIPGALEAVARLNAAGFVVVVVTNQAGVARGLYTEADVERLHAWMHGELAAVGARFDAVYYAPTHPEGTVARYAVEHPDRKPGTGMFERAIEENGLDPARSFMVGDKASDLAPARQLGLATVLVETGYGRTERAAAPADHVAPDLAAAADWILARAAR